MFRSTFLLVYTVDYVDAVKNTMFSTSLEDLSETAAKYTEKAPEPLSRQFTERRSKEDAIKCNRT